MSSFRIRPRFQQTIPGTASAFQQAVKAQLEKPGARCVGTVIPDFIILKIPQAERHYWSPQLSLSLEEAEGNVLIQGLYGPNPSVWAIFFFGYAALGILSLFAGIIGFSRLSLGLEAQILWLLPVFGGIALALYFGAQAGQKVGAAQMFTLHHFLEEVTGVQVRIH